MAVLWPPARFRIAAALRIQRRLLRSPPPPCLLCQLPVRGLPRILLGGAHQARIAEHEGDRALEDDVRVEELLPQLPGLLGTHRKEPDDEEDDDGNGTVKPGDDDGLGGLDDSDDSDSEF